jgi:hypothetical protein
MVVRVYVAISFDDKATDYVPEKSACVCADDSIAVDSALDVRVSAYNEYITPYRF